MTTNLQTLAPLPKKVLSSPVMSRFSKKDLNDDFIAIHKGPTDTSNWLVPGRILMSAYPSDLQEANALLKARQLLSGGIRTFVCLQEKSELRRFKNYQVDIENEFKKMVLQEDLNFLHFEIPDNYYADDTDVDNFTDELVKRFHRGENMLIHCWGGHGRTGTISAILLCKLYDIEPELCLKRVQAVHDCRDNPRGSRAPQTRGQVEQVLRIGQRHLQSGEIEIEPNFTDHTL
jgi:predicted protein tyrosine phosphatase